VGGRPLAFGAVLALVGVLGVLDQTTAKMSADYPTIKKQYESDAGFVHMMEDALPPRSEVFQLPYVEFPEAGFIHKMMDYEHLKPYLHSKQLRFSYGAVKGRETDWSEEAVRGPLETTVRRVAAAGFEAIQIDRFGYGNNAFTFEQALADVIGVGGRTSADERLAFFDLRPYADKLRAELGDVVFAELGRSTTHPVEEIWTGAYELEKDADSYWRWAPERATLTLENPDSEPRTVLVSAELHRVDESPRTVTVTWPDGQSQPFTLAKDPKRLNRTLTLPPGESKVEFITDGNANPSPEGEDRRVAIRNLIVVPEAACGGRVATCGDGPRPQLP
jgi:phosphoglycerol transferase